MEITMKFSKRERYCKAINHVYDHPEKYVVICRGKDYRFGGWYVAFIRL